MLVKPKKMYKQWGKAQENRIAPNVGAYKKIRKVYFQKRTEEREIELLELARDVDHYLSELERLAKRLRYTELYF